MKKTLIVSILTFALLIGILSAPGMAFAKNDCSQNYENITTSLNARNKTLIVGISRNNFASMLQKLNNWYINCINNKTIEPAPAPEEKPEPTPAPEQKPEPTPAPEEKPEPAPAPEQKPEPTPAPEEKPEPAPAPEQKPEPTPAPEEKPEPAPQGIGSQQSQMLDMVNQERVKASLKPLTWDAQLANVAQVKAKDMSDNNYFDHNSPTYGSPFDMMKKFGISYRAAGENLAGSSNVNRAHTGLMNSEGHRKNILNPNFTHLGIGVEKSSRYGYVYVQMFIGK